MKSQTTKDKILLPSLVMIFTYILFFMIKSKSQNKVIYNIPTYDYKENFSD